NCKGFRWNITMMLRVTPGRRFEVNPIVHCCLGAILTRCRTVDGWMAASEFWQVSKCCAVSWMTLAASRQSRFVWWIGLMRRVRVSAEVCLDLPHLLEPIQSRRTAFVPIETEFDWKMLFGNVAWR